jgi:hypothetical protein
VILVLIFSRNHDKRRTLMCYLERKCISGFRYDRVREWRIREGKMQFWKKNEDCDAITIIIAPQNLNRMITLGGFNRHCDAVTISIAAHLNISRFLVEPLNRRVATQSEITLRRNAPRREFL